MRAANILLKKFFILAVKCGLLVLFGFIIREQEIWKPKSVQTQYYQVENTEADINDTILTSDLPIREDNAIDDNVEYLSSPAIIQSKPWYFLNGNRYPPLAKRSRNNGRRIAKLFHQDDPNSDRITNQLMFIHPNYENIKEEGKVKIILLYQGLPAWEVAGGRELFLQSNCPVDTCFITPNKKRADSADLILYKNLYIPTGIDRPSRQISMIYLLESPYHTLHAKVPDAINWTATYRKDSDIVAPYGKWVYYDPRLKQLEQDRNYALNKTKKVAWFVSNCNDTNGRLDYAHELQKFIQVDIYGICGEYSCPRTTTRMCFDILERDYKFYLAFENSNCKEYITEKFFLNALGRNILPVVMGARPEDYENSAPYRSYIHVDEFVSPKELAEYLHILDKNDDLYNSYFKWKGTGEFINTFFWCRVCAMLHDEDTISKPKWYPNINVWWKGHGVCTNKSWRNFNTSKNVISQN